MSDDEFGHGFGSDGDGDDEEQLFNLDDDEEDLPAPPIMKPSKKKVRQQSESPPPFPALPEVADGFAVCTNPVINPKDVVSVIDSSTTEAGGDDGDEDSKPSKKEGGLDPIPELDGDDDDELPLPSPILTKKQQKGGPPPIILQTNEEVEQRERDQLLDHYRYLSKQGYKSKYKDDALENLPIISLRSEIFRLKDEYQGDCAARRYKRWLNLFSKLIEIYAGRLKRYTFGILQLRGFSRQIDTSLRDGDFDECFTGIYHKWSKRQIQSPMWTLCTTVGLCGLNAQLDNMLQIEDKKDDASSSRPNRPVQDLMDSVGTLATLASLGNPGSSSSKTKKKKSMKKPKKSPPLATKKGSSLKNKLGKQQVGDDQDEQEDDARSSISSDSVDTVDVRASLKKINQQYKKSPE